MSYNAEEIETLSTDTVAWLLGTDSKTICMWADSGIIKPCRVTPYGDRWFRRSDVAELLDRIGA